MVEEALSSLCSTSKTFVGASSMIFLILGVLLHAVSYLLNNGRPKRAKRPLLWIGGTVLLVLAVLGLVVYYVLLEPLINLVHGTPGTLPNPCPDSGPESAPPYCGEYCQNNSVPKASENCTCLQY